MVRAPNTDRSGRSFSSLTVQVVWNKGQTIPGYDPAVWRYDSCGAPMRRDLHGSTTEYGWEIDHIHPVAKGGTDDLSNLQPLQWQNNRSKGDELRWTCAVGA